METRIEQQTRDGIVLKGYSWQPEIPALGVIALVHGLGEHVGRYRHVARFLNDHGYAILGFDNRGHGESGGKRGHIPNYEALLETTQITLEQAQALYPGLPVWIYGHSWGGNQVLNYLLRKRPAVKGAIVTGPWLKLPKAPPVIKVFLARIMNGIFPGFSENNGLDSSFLSHDPAVNEAYRKDPLVHARITARTFLECSAAARYALEHAAEIQVPVLLMHGGKDNLTSPAGSAEFAQNAGPNVRHLVWDGLYHEIHNEPQKQEVFNRILQFLTEGGGRD